MNVSICIPIYQVSVQKLVTELAEQCIDLKLSFEICLIDDASAESIQKENKILQKKYPQVRYMQLAENVGRSAIRNQLAAMATGRFCLFLDSDVTIHEPDFIETYLTYLDDKNMKLINGGCIYRMNKKQRENKALRYKYGKFIEEISRNADGTISSPFVGCNFLVSRAVFQQISFSEQLVNYGFEDLLFAIEFEKHFGEYSFIENPVMICDVDDNETYLAKTAEAMQNLAILYYQGKVLPENNIRLLLVYEEIKEKGLLGSFYRLSKNILPLLLINLTSSNPSLKIFQFFKLLQFIKSLREIESSFSS